MRRFTYLARSRVLWLVVATLFMLLRYGYEPLTGANHCYQYIVVQKIAFPYLYPNDAFVEMTWRGYASVLWYLIGYIVKGTDIALEKIDFTLFLTNRMLIVAAFIYIAQLLFPGKRVAPPAAIALLMIGIGTPVGGGQPIRSSMEQTGFAIAFGLFCLGALLQKRPTFVAINLGLCFNFNTMYGIFVLTYVLVTVLLNPIYRYNWKLWLSATLTGIVLGLPGIWLTLAASSSRAEITAVWQASELAYPYHFYPHAFRDAMSIEKHVYLLALAFTAFLILRLHPKDGRVESSLLLWLGTMMGWYGASWIASWAGVLTAVRIQPVRGVDYGYVIFSLYVFCSLAVLLEELLRRRRLFPQRETLLVAGLYCAIGFWTVGQAGIKRFYREGSLIQVALPPCFRASEWARLNTSTDAVFLVPIGMDEGWHNFRHLAQRNVFVTWKDGCAWIWASAYAPEWLDRISALGFFEVASLDRSHYVRGRWIDAYRYNNSVSPQLTEAKVINLAKRYRIDYWVAYVHQETTLPVVYQDERYKIVKIDANR